MTNLQPYLFELAGFDMSVYSVKLVIAFCISDIGCGDISKDHTPDNAVTGQAEARHFHKDRFVCGKDYNEKFTVY